jgi:hypothetical protein
MVNKLVQKMKGQIRVYHLLVVLVFFTGTLVASSMPTSFSRMAAVSTELFTYPSTISYKAGSNTVVTPTIAVAGGVFVAKRITPGPGMISLDEQSGKINLRNSDPGRYSITYTVNGQTQTISIVIS